MERLLLASTTTNLYSFFNGSLPILGCLQSRIGRKSASSGMKITVGTKLRSQCGCNCGQGRSSASYLFSSGGLSQRGLTKRPGLRTSGNPPWHLESMGIYGRRCRRNRPNKLSAMHPDFAHWGWVKRIPGWVWKNGLHCKSGWWTAWTAWTAYYSDFRTLWWPLIRQVWRVSRQCLFLSTKPTHAFATCTSSGWGGLES